MPKSYPEHEKLKTVSDRSQANTGFLRGFAWGAVVTALLITFALTSIPAHRADEIPGNTEEYHVGYVDGYTQGFDDGLEQDPEDYEPATGWDANKLKHVHKVRP